MKEFIEFIAKNIVDDPSSVHVEESQKEDGTTILRLKVAQGETGKVIGKGGKTAQAIRLLLAAVGRKDGKKVNFEILD
ncbi:MAG: UPF0109 protein [Ignavibacteriales bacterium]